MIHAPRLPPLVLALLFAAAPLYGQRPPRLDRVLVSRDLQNGPAALPQDRGAAGLWHRLVKLATTASVLHVTAHPDDEHGDVLTLLSRRDGVRTALLTLNRGEGGANALGPELFDGLGLVRTEELLLSGRYYGLDDQYFTIVVDYGYSKTLDEAYRSWDREALLEDMVRVIRINRPLVVVSRFHGSARDGHGHHQAAGDLTPEAVRAAGDSTRFPRQLVEEGLRPWQALRLYRGGLAEMEFHHLSVHGRDYSPWLATSYAAFAAEGVSLQRSQTSGRVRPEADRIVRRYERLPAAVTDSVAAVTGSGFFDGLDTTLNGIFALTGEPGGDAAREATARADRAVSEALAGFDPRRPEAVVPALAEALGSVRAALSASTAAPEAAFLLSVKERQLEDALAAAVDLRLSAVAIDTADAGDPDTATLGPVVEGQELIVWTTVTTHAPDVTGPLRVRLVAAGDWRGTVERVADPTGPVVGADAGSVARYRVRHLVTLPPRLEPTRPPVHREDVRENRYQVRDSAALHLPWSSPVLVAEASATVGGETVRVRDAVRVRESALPYGTRLRELAVVPAVSVRIEPRVRLVALGETPSPVDVRVEVVYAGPRPIRATVRLDRPRGWAIAPGVVELEPGGPGERRTVSFRVTPRSIDDVGYPVVAVVTAGGRSFREGARTVRYPDLEPRRLFEPSQMTVIGAELATVPGLRVAYVMGVGDRVPPALEQLGASVTPLDDDALASADLSVFDAVVVGTRAYAVRPALVTHNDRLLDYARRGGHLIVLYQTPEFVPAETAPYPATLPAGAEEVSEEDAPVRLLSPDHPLLQRPNRIGARDFDGWIEQRGSKFWATWDPAYTPLVETHDTGQDDQRGVWLTAEYGSGRYTYCALALHRQLPWGVVGAYRILANLVAAGRE